jgi:xanthine dehydrogenase YagS FAD-binding subunit
VKTFKSANPATVQEAVTLLSRGNAAPVGGGSDLLGMVKEHLISPEVLVNLRSIQGLDKMRLGKIGRIQHPDGSVTQDNLGVRIGGLVTLATIADDPRIRTKYSVLAQAAAAVGTPQIRNAGTIAGNLSQRPWCWYYRNGFPCFKNGGKTCFSVTGENEFHAIFGGGPSYIVHPSDTAPALVALDATFTIAGPKGTRVIPAADFFTLPAKDPSKENVLAQDEVLIEVRVGEPGWRSSYHKELDRESWTHAVVSVATALEMNGDICHSARIVLGGVAPIPWRVPDAEALLTGKRITPELAAEAGEIAVAGAKPLAKNKYKIPLTKAVVKRSLIALASS